MSKSLNIPQVPFISQRGNSLRNDCGPACLLMIARWYEPHEWPSLKDIANTVDPTDDGTPLSNMTAWLRNYGIRHTVSREVENYPAIVLVNYRDMGLCAKADFLHWVVMLAPGICHDPYCYTANTGAFRRVSVKPLASINVIKFTKVINADWLRLRSEPGFNGSHIAWIPPATVFDVSTSTTVANQRWYRAHFSHNLLRSPVSQAQFLDITGWVAAWLTRPYTQQRVPVGLHTLYDSRSVWSEFEQNCNAFTIMDNFATAGEVLTRKPEIIVITRRFFYHGILPNPDQIMERLPVYKGARVVILNENDQIGVSYDDLPKRASVEIECARRIRNAGGIPLIGSWSMGTPDFTNQSICDRIRELYAEGYNNGLFGVDMHLYSPSRDNLIKNDPIWYERRFEFLFTKCGFNPVVRQIYASEGGLDVMGLGGFKGVSMQGHEVRDWLSQYQATLQRDMTVNGKVFPSPLRCVNLFQCSKAHDWSSYDVTGYLEEIRKFY